MPLFRSSPHFISFSFFPSGLCIPRKTWIFVIPQSRAFIKNMCEASDLLLHWSNKGDLQE